VEVGQCGLASAEVVEGAGWPAPSSRSWCSAVPTCVGRSTTARSVIWLQGLEGDSKGDEGPTGGLGSRSEPSVDASQVSLE